MTKLRRNLLGESDGSHLPKNALSLYLDQKSYGKLLAITQDTIFNCVKNKKGLKNFYSFNYLFVSLLFPESINDKKKMHLVNGNEAMKHKS